MREFGVAVAVFMLACCAGYTQYAERAQLELVGLPRAELLACAGVPHGSAIESGLEFFTYDSNSIVGAMSGGVGSQFTFACRATFVLDQGKVRQVRYSGGRTGKLLDPLGECGKIVRACLQ